MRAFDMANVAIFIALNTHNNIVSTMDVDTFRLQTHQKRIY